MQSKLAVFKSFIEKVSTFGENFKLDDKYFPVNNFEPYIEVNSIQFTLVSTAPLSANSVISMLKEIVPKHPVERVKRLIIQGTVDLKSPVSEEEPVSEVIIERDGLSSIRLSNDLHNLLPKSYLSLLTSAIFYRSQVEIQFMGNFLNWLYISMKNPIGDYTKSWTVSEVEFCVTASQQTRFEILMNSIDEVTLTDILLAFHAGKTISVFNLLTVTSDLSRNKSSVDTTLSSQIHVGMIWFHDGETEFCYTERLLCSDRGAVTTIQTLRNISFLNEGIV